MFNFFNSTPDEDGFTKKDKRTYELYKLLLQKGESNGGPAAAAAFLTKHGWTVDYANTVGEHFFPVRIYTQDEMNAAREGMALITAGDKAAGIAVHSAHGLNPDDIEGCIEQFYAEILGDDDEDEDEDDTVAPRLYTAAEIAAVRQGMEIYLAGDREAGRAFIASHGLDMDDAHHCLKQAAEPATADNA